MGQATSGLRGPGPSEPDRSHDFQPAPIPHGVTASDSNSVGFAQREVERNKALLGPDHPETLSSMFKLGEALHANGRIEKALRIFEELLPLNETAHGQTHAYTLIALNAIYEELCNMGKYEQCLVHLKDERDRCEYSPSLGPNHERTIRILIDIANACKLLERSSEAASFFSLALERARTGLGSTHHVTLAIQYDIRGLKTPAPPDLEKMKALLRRNNLPAPLEPFPVSSSTGWRDISAGKSISGLTSVGYEASNAMFLRIGPINGSSKATPPVSIFRDVADPNDVDLGAATASGQMDHSLKSLIDRSIGLLPRGGTPVTRQAVKKYTSVLKGFKSLDELLTAKETPFWFFQHRESFVEQTKFQKWDSDALGRYVLPTDGEFANSEECIFVSHYWRAQPHPDPHGEDLRQLQELLKDGFWRKAAFVLG